jgi:hypothetical protein
MVMFSQVLNVRNVSVVQIEVYKAEPLIPGPSLIEVETAVAKLKRYKSQVIKFQRTV